MKRWIGVLVAAIAALVWWLSSRTGEKRQVAAGEVAVPAVATGEHAGTTAPDVVPVELTVGSPS